MTAHSHKLKCISLNLNICILIEISQIFSWEFNRHKSALVKIITQRWSGSKPLPQLMTTQMTDNRMVSLGYNELTSQTEMNIILIKAVYWKVRNNPHKTIPLLTCRLSCACRARRLVGRSCCIRGNPASSSGSVSRHTATSRSINAHRRRWLYSRLRTVCATW